MQHHQLGMDGRGRQMVLHLSQSIWVQRGCVLHFIHIPSYVWLLVLRGTYHYSCSCRFTATRTWWMAWLVAKRLTCSFSVQGLNPAWVRSAFCNETRVDERFVQNSASRTSCQRPKMRISIHTMYTLFPSVSAVGMEVIDASISVKATKPADIWCCCCGHCIHERQL